MDVCMDGVLATYNLQLSCTAPEDEQQTWGVTPLSRGKSSEPNFHHFQVPAVNLRGCNCTRQPFQIFGVSPTKLWESKKLGCFHHTLHIEVWSNGPRFRWGHLNGHSHGVSEWRVGNQLELTSWGDVFFAVAGFCFLGECFWGLLKMPIIICYMSIIRWFAFFLWGH